MPAGVQSVFDVVATHATAELNASLELMTTHLEQATRLHEQATVRVPGELSYMTHWESPEALRTWANEQHQADLHQQAMHHSAGVRVRALMRSYAHACLCRVRTTAQTVARSVPQSLAQVSAGFRPAGYALRHAPPLVPVPDVLSTCHASNAPGLTGVATRHWQAYPTE